jgi:lipoprotein-anchoring transpeptidase ErfK/SrfK
MLMPHARRLQFLRDKIKFFAKKRRMFCRLTGIVIFSLAATAFAVAPINNSSEIIVSVREQKLVLVQNGAKVATYPISTSMFGLGDAWGHMTTPLGYLAVEKKIGDNAPVGAVFHNRKLTGEILQPDAPGRDPITTRIIWLRGLEAQNAHAYQRCIYIHGTPEEKKIGRPASYGCIRMKASDVAALYNQVTLGTIVQIVPDALPKIAKTKAPRSEASNGIVAVTAPPPPPPQNQTQQPEQQAERPQKVTQPRHVHRRKTVVAANALAAPPEHLLASEPQAEDELQSEPKATSSTPSVEQMRMSGAIAAQRQKAKVASNKRF